MIREPEIAAVMEVMNDGKKYQGFRYYVGSNEPYLMKWISETSTNMLSSMNVAFPPQMAEQLRAKLMTAMLEGYMVSMIHNNLVNCSSIGMDEFSLLYNNDPGKIYDEWLSGKLDEKFYREEEVGCASKSPDWATAVENWKKRNTEESVSRDVFKMIKDADNAKAGKKIEDGEKKTGGRKSNIKL